MNFMTIGDRNFFKPIAISVQQVKKFYPESTFYVYDWGFDKNQREILNSLESVVLVDWEGSAVDTSPLDHVDWVEVISRQRKDNMPHGGRKLGLKRTIKQLNSQMLWSVLKYRYGKKRLRFEKKAYQKPYCIKDCLYRNSGPLVFLDGDALLMNTINEVFDKSYDIGVTVRRSDEIDLKQNQCLAINVGVIFFSNSESCVIHFMDHWISNMRKMPEWCCEQSALTRLLIKKNTRIFDQLYCVTEGYADKGNVSVKTFPCDRYNFLCWAEEEVNTENNRIVHLKGWQQRSEKLETFFAETGIQNKLTDTFEVD